MANGLASLVIQTSFLGDTVLTTPLMARLAEQGPVDVLVTPASARLLANHPAIRETIVYDKRGRDGFETSSGRAFYSVRVPAPLGMHHAEKLFTLGSAGGGRPWAREDLRPRLYPGAEERQVVDELLGAGADGDRPLVALAPGSVWATKRWPHYPALARSLASRARIVVIGGHDDAP